MSEVIMSAEVVPEGLIVLPLDPDGTEVYYHIRTANNRVRVVLRNPYAHMGDDRLMNLRLEVKTELDAETCDWIMVPDSRRGLMPGDEVRALGARVYHGGWREMITQAMTSDHDRHPSFWQQYLVKSSST